MRSLPAREPKLGLGLGVNVLVADAGLGGTGLHLAGPRGEKPNQVLRTLEGTLAVAKRRAR